VHVVATAGHVDHGKSTLVRALTGQDPDRLEEERRRGLSIELGYCWTALEPIGEVAFVDVPGHERFLSTTLAGLGPVPAAMLVVAADDPWMPQAAEHLAALDALGIRHGVLAVTRSDLADPGPSLTRARAELARTSLADAPAVVVSGRTGAGLDALRDALAGVLAAMPVPDPASDVRLWVDRAFHVRGAGTVVTGTLPAGTVRIGDVLLLHGEPVRVRGLECLGRAVDEVSGPARVAVQLGGRVPDEPGRGAALTTPGAFVEVTEVDVRLDRDGPLPERPLLHLGSTRQAVRGRPLGDRHARLRLDAPLPLRHGDRVVLRDPGSRELWGAEALDVDPPALSRRGAARERAEVLAVRGQGVEAELAARGAVRRSRLRQLGVDGPAPDDALAVGDWLVSADRAAAWRAALTDAVRRTPDGLFPAEAVRALGLPDPDLLDLAVTDPVRRVAGRLVVETALPEPVRAALDVLRADLGAAPFRAPDAERLAELGLDRAALARLARTGELLVVGDGVALLPGTDDAAVTRLASLPQPFTTSEARQALDTSRRVVLPLLAHLDRTGRTVRLPDDTRCVR
jgi:selenocysteine-specific elongation factor